MTNPSSSAQRSFAAEPYDSVAAVLASPQITSALIGERIHAKDGAAFEVVDPADADRIHPLSGVGLKDVSPEVRSTRFSSLISAAARAITRKAVLNVAEDEASTTDTITPDAASSSNTISVRGAGMRLSVLNHALAKAAFIFRNYARFEGFSIRDLGLGKSGVGISTGATSQSYFTQLRDLTIGGQKFGYRARYSLWESFVNLIFVDNACGVRHARGAFVDDNSNPAATGGWNMLDGNGFYNNQNVMQNVLFSRGEVGYWGSPMGATFIGVTTQGQKADGVNNVVLPAGQLGTGMIIEWKGDGTRGWQNATINRYTEASDRGDVIRDQRQFLALGGFYQGGASASRADFAIQVDNSEADLRAITGQDYFDKFIHAINGSVVYVEGVSGPITATQGRFVTDATSRIKPRGRVDSDKYEFSLSKPAGDPKTFTLPVAIPQRATARLYLTGIYDGSSSRFGICTIQRVTGALHQITWEGGTAPTGVTVSLSTGTLSVTLSGAQSYSTDVVLHIVAGRDVSGNVIAIAPDA